MTSTFRKVKPDSADTIKTRVQKYIKRKQRQWRFKLWPVYSKLTKSVCAIWPRKSTLVELQDTTPWLKSAKSLRDTRKTTPEIPNMTIKLQCSVLSHFKTCKQYYNDIDIFRHTPENILNVRQTPEVNDLHLSSPSVNSESSYASIYIRETKPLT